jgi:hypothetical protein
VAVPKSGAPSATLLATRNNSWVFAVGNDYDNAFAHIRRIGETVIHQMVSTVEDTNVVQTQMRHSTW